MTRARDVADTQDNSGGAVAPFVSGKNRVINADFGIWTRGTSFSFNNQSAYTADRWYAGCSNVVTVSQQAFTAGTAPVAGYESTYFARFNRTSRPTIYDDYFLQRIEDVRTFAGQTITFSFWAKTNSGTTTLSGAYVEQWFGSGGSSSVYVNTSGPLTLTTTWQRFSTTMTMPSIAGKTIGTGSFVAINFAMANSLGTSAAYDIWGVQVEAANVATPFTLAGGGFPGAELALCQRYGFRRTGSNYEAQGYAVATSTTSAYIVTQPPQTMRTYPSSIDFSNLALYDFIANTQIPVTNVVVNWGGIGNLFSATITVASGLTSGRTYNLNSYNNSAGYYGAFVEL